MDEKHEDFKRDIGHSNKLDFHCPYCVHWKGEKRIEDWLISNNINYIIQMKFDDLIGTGNGLLSYDFYLLAYNLLIEYQGNFHDGSANVSILQTKEMLIKQIEHDKRKKEYAKEHNINFLEIWYWDFNNIEEILKEVLIV